MKYSPESRSNNCGKLYTGKLLPESELKPDQGIFPNATRGGLVMDQ